MSGRSGQGGDETLERGHVGDRRAVPGRIRVGLEVGEPADRAAVLGWVIGEDLRWLLDPGKAVA